jgi:phosphoglycolate phosphatase-like HAD superfamily hydrolase
VPHVIWDWNGTLLDDLPAVIDAVNACLKSQGGPVIDAETYRRRFVRPLNGFYEALLGTPIDDDLLARLDDVFQAAYWDGIDRVSLNSESVASIKRVRAQRATQSIASMLWHDMLVPAVREFGLDGPMVALDGNRGAVGDTKEQHMVEHVARLRRLFPHLAHDRITVIGDIVDDADAARAAGVDCVLYNGGSQVRSELETRGVPVVDSLLEAVDLALRPVA